ncbi:hypothetical protein OROMI_022930 [Orobanche minor]
MANREFLKYMTRNFEKLDKFVGQDFRRWQKKMHFMLTNLTVMYVLSTPMPEIVEDETLEPARRRLKWENNDYICRGHILNGMSDSLFDVYQNLESAKELWDSLEAKYMAEDASSKKFLVGNFINYKMVDSRPVMEQYNELLRILGQFAQYEMKMNESISVSSIIDKLPPSWREFKNNLKHKEELTLVELGSHFQIEQSIRDMEKVSVGDAKTMAGSTVNMMEEGESSKANKGKRKFQGNNSKAPNKKPKLTCWKCGKTGHFKKDCKSGKGGGKVKNMAASNGSKDHGKQSAFYVQDDNVSWWVDSGATCHVCRDLQ